MTRKKRQHFVRILLVSFGLLFVALGVIGILVPLLPTTPFLLLAAFCFVRSSDRLYQWLMTNRLFGSYIHDYIHYRSVPMNTKIFAVTLLWVTITISIILTKKLIVAGILILIASAVTAHILRLKTRK